MRKLIPLLAVVALAFLAPASLPAAATEARCQAPEDGRWINHNADLQQIRIIEIESRCRGNRTEMRMPGVYPLLSTRLQVGLDRRLAQRPRADRGEFSRPLRGARDPGDRNGQAHRGAGDLPAARSLERCRVPRRHHGSRLTLPAQARGERKNAPHPLAGHGKLRYPFRSGNLM